MITTDEGLRLALDQLSQTYQALAGLRTDHPEAGPGWRSVLSEGFLDHARQLREEIDAYTGAAGEASAGAPEQFEGDLRAIDLDERTATIRNAGDVREVRCGLDESVLGAAREALDRRVRVWGVRRAGTGRRGASALRVFRLEVLEEGPSAEEPGAAREAGVPA